MRVVSLSVVAVCAAACADFPERQGQITVCSAVVENEGEEPIGDEYSIRHTLVGLHAADPDASWPAPTRFTSCISTIAAPVQVELIDQNGAHVWLAVDVVARGQQLITPAVLADIEDGRLDIASERDVSFNDAVKLTSAEGEVRLALNDRLPLDPAFIDLPFVEDDGADGLPTWTSCSAVTARKLAFSGVPLEGAAVVLKNGEVGATGGSNGTEYIVTNVGSFEYGEDTNCEDTVKDTTLYSWAVIIDR